MTPLCSFAEHPRNFMSKILPKAGDSPIGTAFDWCKMAGHRTDSTTDRAAQLIRLDAQGAAASPKGDEKREED
ncbi:hypothetical protein [Sphingopyxis microcysteis]|jgi:hypothetical protein|uniref:hypothetical protein n=1 Tax=Sphingopyxis microcysteis TaxID=2484145 RepID=UPI0014451637|nr:hypothetical protein [Sphingopyxis microcysteis]